MMKLGVSYIVFDGCELLEQSINQIRPFVDHICVVYQTTSWFGAQMSTKDIDTLRSLKARRVISELINFTSFVPLRDHSMSSVLKAKKYEKAKRQVGLSNCIGAKCTHYLGMDVDEFYDRKQFAAAKSYIETHDIGTSACRFVNYVHLPTISRGLDTSRVPFICKIANNSEVCRDFFTKCDPTRGITPLLGKHHEFSPVELVMHHMETVRRNLLSKYASTTRAVFDRGKSNELVNLVNSVNESTQDFSFHRIIFPGLKNVKLTKCSNQFNIPYSTWK